jgi:hypothetical protein
MLGARFFVSAAPRLCFCALLALGTSAASAQTVDLSLNVFYSNPANINSGGSWQLVGKSTNFGIAGVEARLKNIATSLEKAPRATINGEDEGGFNLYVDQPFPTYRGIIVGQTPIALEAGEEQGAFYGVGTLTNGSPDYPTKPAGTNSIGPVITSLTAPIAIPWATGDPMGDPLWATSAVLASGTFATNVSPNFETGSSGQVFTTLGSSSTFGLIAPATTTTVVRTFIGSADYNDNGIVDAADYALWRNFNGQSVPNGFGPDGNFDGVVNQADYNFWRSRFGLPMGAGSGGSLSTGAVPEPWSGILLVVGAILVVSMYPHVLRRRELAARPLLSSTRSLAVAPKTADQELIVFCANRRE